MLNRAIVEGTALAVLALAVLFLWVREQRQARPESDGGYTTREEVEFEIGRIQSELSRWLTTTDHRDIGLLYIFVGTAAGLWGGATR